MTRTLIDDLRGEIAAGRVIAVLGAGVSAAATGGSEFSSWKGLIQHGVRYSVEVNQVLNQDWQQLQLSHLRSKDIKRWLKAAEEITSALGGPGGGDYTRWLRETLGSLRCEDPQLLQSVFALTRSIWTTNYDGVIEEATGIRPATWKQRSVLDRVVRGDEERVVHLHGFWEQPETVVLGIRSYERLLKSEHARNTLRGLVGTHTLLFIGFGAGLADPNFAAFRQWLRRAYGQSEYRHYRLATRKEAEAIDSDQSLKERIFILSYGNSYSDLPEFLGELSTTRKRRRRQQPSPVLGETGITKPRIAISMGDANGIGPEVVLKSLREFSEVRRICIPLVVGSAGVLSEVRETLEPRIAIPPIITIDKPRDAKDSQQAIWVIDVPISRRLRLWPRAPDAEVAQLSIACMRQALDLARTGEVAAVVSAPVSKEACLQVDSGIRGHTELVGQTLGLQDYGSLYISPDLAIAAVTGHCPLSEVLPQLTKERIVKTIVRAGRHLKVWRPDAPRRIGVCSINPHVGEGGWLGSEDQDIVVPAVAEAAAELEEEFAVTGPISADAIFRPQIRNEYGLIVAMYHDQAKVAAASLDPNTFVAVVVGSPIVRTTVTHGTAFDIAGDGRASAANLITAIEQAVYLSPRGLEYLRTSRDITATKFYSVTVRLNTYTKEKNLLGDALIRLPQVTQFFGEAGEELRVIVGPGSTPTLVIEHLLTWIGRLSKERQRLVHIVTSSLELLENIRQRGEFRARISLFGALWDPSQNSLGPPANLDEVLRGHGANMSIISCSGIDISGGEVQFYAYTRDHAGVLKAIVNIHAESRLPASVNPLIILATGEKLGKLSPNLYCGGVDLPENSILLLEVERQIRVAVGAEEIRSVVREAIHVEDVASRRP